MKFCPYEKKKGGGVSNAKGGHKRFWGSFYAVAFEAILKEGGGRKMLNYSRL